MRINKTENFVVFKSLKISENSYNRLANQNLKDFEKKLANTKYFDVIIDSYSYFLKDKKTDIQNWIQSFSLFIQEKAVGINLSGDTKKTLMIHYNNIDEAKKVWNELRAAEKNNRLEGYAKTALILDKQFDYKA